MNFYYSQLNKESNQIIIEDDQVHHFKNVQRGKEGELAKVFNGSGLVASAKVTNLSKKELHLEIQNVEKVEKYKLPKLIVGTPKKEYIESILRSATQMGVSEIIFMDMKFTPRKFKWSSRMDKILISSIIQSENPYLPKVTHLDEFNRELFENIECYVFSTEISGPVNPQNVDCIVIGPEGGFSEDEIEFFAQCPSCHLVRCPTPIMKAEVAVSFCMGLVQKL